MSTNQYMKKSAPSLKWILVFVLFAFVSFVSCSGKTVPEKSTASSNENPPARTSSHRSTATKKAKPLPPAPYISTSHMEQDILHYINLHRRSLGLKPLKSNSVESSVAAQHSRNMASGRTPFGHRGLQLRMNAIERQLGNMHTTAENVAYGIMDAKEVVEGWLGSEGHRKNIEGDFVLTGIGVAKDAKGYIYYTEIFTR